MFLLAYGLANGRPMSAQLAEYCVGTGSYFRFLVRPTPINGKHTDKFTFLLDINNVSSLYYLAIHLCTLHAFITQTIRHKCQGYDCTVQLDSLYAYM